MNRRQQNTAPPTSPLWWLLIGGLVFTLIALTLGVLGGAFLVTGTRALAGVSVGGVAVGGLNVDEAEAAFTNWTLLLTDGERSLPIAADSFGAALDAAASAETAVSYGRSQGGISGLLRALFSQVEVAPVFQLDRAQAEGTLLAQAAAFDRAPVNAGVRYENGELLPRPAQMGQVLNVEATLASLAADGLNTGIVRLVMTEVAPALTDPAPIVEAARALLARPLSLRLIDPIANETITWDIGPETWAAWIVPVPASQPDGRLPLTLDSSQAAAYLVQRSAELGSDRTLNADEAASNVAASFQTDGGAWARIYHRDIDYQVQPGDTIISIAYAYGIPYPYVQQANPGVDSLSPGQVITLPSRDVMLPLPLIPGKRIVVSISSQHLQAFENGAIVFDWVASTGISSSPTWPGVYQILEHEANAYAGNWDLWMPNFMGVYRPIPGADFTNGFHGFPTRGGSQLLWTNSLGTPVTYGCILVSNDNIQQLYDWAEDGVVVEIQP